MPLTLASRIGPDTLGKLEHAARRRYAEASLLMREEPLGAIYLFGYTVEMRLKAAYFRVRGLSPNSTLAPERLLAEAQIRVLLGVNSHVAVGHHLPGWALLVEDARATIPGATPLSAAFATKMHGHVRDVRACWTEVLRYRANRPYNQELHAVAIGARWFKSRYRSLWS